MEKSRTLLYQVTTPSLSLKIPPKNLFVEGDLPPSFIFLALTPANLNTFANDNMSLKILPPTVNI